MTSIVILVAHNDVLLEWEPDEHAFRAFIKMERRYKEIDRARSIYERRTFGFLECQDEADGMDIMLYSDFLLIFDTCTVCVVCL